MSRRNFRTYTIALTANIELPLTVAGNMYAVIDNTGDFTITFDESNRIVKATAGTGGEFVDGYSDVKLLSTTTQTVTIVLGYGKYNDARATVNATVNTTIAPSNTINNPGDVTAGAAASLAIAANADRKVVKFTLPSTATENVRLGNASVTASSGDLLEPGMSVSYNDESAWYVIREGSSDQNVTVLELERP